MNLKDKQVVFSTEWFKVIARHYDELEDPYYEIEQNDYVTIVATDGERLVLVKQFRPIVDTYTLELPSGAVDDGETPEEAVKRELMEETGYKANSVELVGAIHPDTGRLGNKMWCYYSSDIEIIPDAEVEEGLEPIVINLSDLKDHLLQGKINNALHLAALNLTHLKGYLGEYLNS